MEVLRFMHHLGYRCNNEVHSAARRLGDVEDQQLGQIQRSSFLCWHARECILLLHAAGASGFGPKPDDLDFVEVFAGLAHALFWLTSLMVRVL